MQSTTRFGTSRFGTLCAMTLTAAGLLVMPAAQAQQQSPSGTSVTTPSPPTPTNIPDKKLDAAAAAVKKVSVIKNKYDQQLAQVPVAEKQRLEGEAGDAMAKAVIDQGLSVEEYTAILKVAQKDPVVRDKLLQRMK
jgi:predicted ATPase with chaperone activity